MGYVMCTNTPLFTDFWAKLQHFLLDDISLSDQPLYTIDSFEEYISALARESIVFRCSNLHPSAVTTLRLRNFKFYSNLPTSPNFSKQFQEPCHRPRAMANLVSHGATIVEPTQVISHPADPSSTKSIHTEGCLVYRNRENRFFFIA